MVVPGGCVQDGVCLCSRTWVLVIHNDFDGIENLNRLGDDVDVKNLRRVFETQRGCRFRELHNRGSEEIVQTLSQEELLIQLFNADGQDDPRFCPPAAFILFILSHGDCGGVILTDHFKNETDPADLKFQTYTTKDVWNLANIEFIRSSLKLLFLGPCRGNIAEFKLRDGHAKDKVQTLPGLLSSQPNKENFVILYATVESTMANRCEVDGTWFIQAIYKELENLTVNLPLLDFLTRIQFQLCAKNTIISSNVGQTSQLHFFYHEQFTVCSKKNTNSQERAIPFPPIMEQTDNYPLHDISAESSSLPWVSVQYDAKAGNLNGLLTFDKLMNYDWLDKNNIQLKRGKAIIFLDRRHYECAKKMVVSLRGLGYTTSLHDVCNIKSIITKTCPKRGFKNDGSFVLCVLTHLFETENGLMIKVADKNFLLSKIIDEYTGKKCSQLIGKPKLFFFLDNEPNIKTDGELTPEIKTPVSFNKYFNLHAGVCTFVGVRSGPKGSKGDVIQNLVEELGSPQLKEEGSNLQTVLAEIIAKSTEDKSTEEEQNCIKPQFLSTLPQFVNFTPFKSPYEKQTYNVYQRVFGTALLTSILCTALTLVLVFALRVPRFLLVKIDDTCGISFTGSNSLENDTFSLNYTEWSKISANCSSTWKDTYSLEYSVINSLKHYDSEPLVPPKHLLEKSENKRESLYRVILFGYSTKNLLKLIQFSSSMDTAALRLDGLRAVGSRIAVHCEVNETAVFELSHALKNMDKQLENKISNCTDTVITEFCLKADKHFIRWFFFTVSRIFKLYNGLKYLSDGAQKQFVPLIIVKCFQNITLSNFDFLIRETRKLFPNIACSAYQILFSEMKKQNHLGSAKAFQLRMNIESFNISNQEQKQKCNYVADALKLHFHEHAQLALELFDKYSTSQNCDTIYGTRGFMMLNDDIISYLVTMRYNGSSENAKKIQKCFFADHYYMMCKSTIALIKEFKIYNKPMSIEFFNTFLNISQEMMESNSSSTEESLCRSELVNVAPLWIQEFVFDAKPVCNYGKDVNCTDSVIQDLGLILSDFETMRNFSKGPEVMYVDFVLHSINISAEVWLKVEPLSKRVEPLKKNVLKVLAQNIFVKNITIAKSYTELLLKHWKHFRSRILNSYLPEIVREAYLIRGIEGMSQFLEKLKVFKMKFKRCDGIYSLYLAMKQENITNLETIDALYLYKYTMSIANRSEKCELVMTGLKNYSEKGMDKYENYFRQNTSKSLNILKDCHRKYKDSSLWIIPQLIDRFISKEEPYVFQILHFLKKLPRRYNLCPGVVALSNKTSCNNSTRVLCTEVCKFIPAYVQDFNYDNLYMCTKVQKNYCKSDVNE